MAERRSDRVLIRMPIEVRGTDLEGRDFQETATTHQVGRHGASILLQRALATGQEITIQRAGGKTAALARIVGQLGIQGYQHVYGVALPEAVNIWGIHFPQISEADQAVARVLLECQPCQNREVVYLNEIELEVFEVNRIISRSCGQCHSFTPWKQVMQEPAEKQEDLGGRSVAEAKAKGSGVAAAKPRPQNRRRHARVKIKMSACIRQPGSEDDLVAVANVSRGGLCFVSAKAYREGAWIEVAAPYTPGAANIFVSGRIVRSQLSTIAGSLEYAVEYSTRK